MPRSGKTLKPADQQNYVLCEECSEEEGEEVYYHKRSIVDHKPMFGAPGKKCPMGHEVKVGGAE